MPNTASAIESLICAMAHPRPGFTGDFTMDLLKFQILCQLAAFVKFYNYVWSQILHMPDSSVKINTISFIVEKL